MLPSAKNREWHQYAIANSFSAPNRYVFHVCHVDDAFRIFEDGEIHPSLVCDESKLRTTRTSVVWLSPNDWRQGFRYGSVAFKFEWKRLVEGKQLYWVEAVNYYHPPAFRILVSHQPVIPLELYPAQTDDGPLFHDAAHDAWFYNGRCTGEFLFDGAIPLSKCVSVLFVKHHPTMCTRNPPCNDLGAEGDKCGARLLARLIAQPKIRHVRRLFREQQSGRLHRNSAEALGHLIRSLAVDKNKGGKIRHAHSAAPYLACAILDRFGTHQQTAALRNLFRNTHELRQAINERASLLLPALKRTNR